MDSVENHKFIIYCGHGINALGIIRSLHEKRIKPIVIFNRNMPVNYVECCRFIGKKHYIDDSLEGLKLLLAEYGNEEYPPFVFTADDYHTMLLDQNYDCLAGRFYFFNCGKNMRLTTFLNKDEQCRIAEESGFTVPAWEVVKKGILPKTLNYPVITKSISSNEGGWKKDVFVCSNEEELNSAYKRIEGDRLLLEEYVNKKCEITLHGFSINAGEQVFIPCCSKDHVFSKTTFGNYLKFQPVKDATLLEHTTTLIRKTHYTGLFCVDLVVNILDELLFFEINMRSGSRNYAVTAGGANLPYLWAQATINSSLPTNISIKESFYAVDEMADFMQNKRKIGRWLSDLKHADTFLWYYKHDNAPIRRYVGYKLARGIKKLI